MKLFFIILATAFSLQVEAATIKLTTGNTVNFRGAVDGQSITSAQIKLSELISQRGKAGYPIYLVFDSPGGSIVAGDAFIQFAKMLPNVHTISIFAASMASGIVEAMPGRRYVTHNGIMMFHRASGTFQGQFESGEIEQQLEFFKKVVREMEMRNASRMLMTLEAYKDKVKDEYWLYGNDAVEKKAADELVNLECSPDLIKKRENSLVQSLFGSFNVSWSGCPLFRAPIQASGNEEEEE